MIRLYPLPSYNHAIPPLPHVPTVPASPSPCPPSPYPQLWHLWASPTLSTPLPRSEMRSRCSSAMAPLGSPKAMSTPSEASGNTLGSPPCPDTPGGKPKEKSYWLLTRASLVARQTSAPEVSSSEMMLGTAVSSTAAHWGFTAHPTPRAGHGAQPGDTCAMGPEAQVLLGGQEVAHGGQEVREVGVGEVRGNV